MGDGSESGKMDQGCEELISAKKDGSELKGIHPSQRYQGWYWVRGMDQSQDKQIYKDRKNGSRLRGLYLN